LAIVLALLTITGAWWVWEGKITPVAAKPASIAVLPFENLSGDPADGRIADGITEDIITDLSRFREFAVIAKDSTEAYRNKPIDVRRIGKDLNVSHVLRGSFQRDGETIRVSAQLIDANTGANFWSERYDRPAGEIFAIQTDVADRIVNNLGGHG